MRLREHVLTALLAAALCVMAPLAVPMGPIPVTLGTLGVYVAAGLLDLRRSVTAVGLYLLLGAVGLPVFAGFTAGFPQLMGVTGGFLWGYLLCAVTVGWLCRMCRRPLWVPVWLACGALLLYVIGTMWYQWQTGAAVSTALMTCVVPFLPAEGIKIGVASWMILSLRGRVSRMVTQDVYCE